MLDQTFDIIPKRKTYRVIIVSIIGNSHRVHSSKKEVFFSLWRGNRHIFHQAAHCFLATGAFGTLKWNNPFVLTADAIPPSYFFGVNVSNLVKTQFIHRIDRTRKKDESVITNGCNDQFETVFFCSLKLLLR